MIGISEENFKQIVKIRFNNINQGFSTFKYKTLEDKNSNGDFIGFILECFKLNEGKNSHVDFYYYMLDENSKNKFKGLLEKDDKMFFENNIINLEKKYCILQTYKKFYTFFSEYKRTKDSFFNFLFY